MGAWIGDVAARAAAAELVRDGDRQTGAQNERGMTDMRDERARRLRRALRPRARRRLVGARPGQPHRRAHRLQRRLRAAVRDRPAHRGRARRCATTAMLRVAQLLRRRGRRDRARRARARRRCTAGRPTRSASRGRSAQFGADLAAVPGFDIYIDSDVPVGAGLSSSAAIESAVALALNDVWQLGLDRAHARPGRPARRERRRRRAHRHHGPVGVAARRGATPRSSSTAARLDAEIIPLGFDAAGLAIARHRHRGRATSTRPAATRERRASCEAGRRGCSASRRCATSTSTTSPRAASVLDDETFRRVRHVVTENQRVLDTVRTLREQGPTAIGDLLDASHRSMRDDFEISVPELDLAVETAQANGAIGARMTGGGFGGSAIALVPDRRALACAGRRRRRVRRARLRAARHLHRARRSDGALAGAVTARSAGESPLDRGQHEAATVMHTAADGAQAGHVSVPSSRLRRRRDARRTACAPHPAAELDGQAGGQPSATPTRDGRPRPPHRCRPMCSSPISARCAPLRTRPSPPADRTTVHAPVKPPTAGRRSTREFLDECGSRRSGTPITLDSIVVEQRQHPRASRAHAAAPSDQAFVSPLGLYLGGTSQGDGSEPCRRTVCASALPEHPGWRSRAVVAECGGRRVRRRRAAGGRSTATASACRRTSSAGDGPIAHAIVVLSRGCSIKRSSCGAHDSAFASSWPTSAQTRHRAVVPYFGRQLRDRRDGRARARLARGALRGLAPRCAAASRGSSGRRRPGSARASPRPRRRRGRRRRRACALPVSVVADAGDADVEHGGARLDPVGA